MAALKHVYQKPLLSRCLADSFKTRLRPTRSNHLSLSLGGGRCGRNRVFCGWCVWVSM